MTFTEIIARFPISRRTLDYVFERGWIPGLEAQRIGKGRHSRVFSVTESLAIVIAAQLHTEHVSVAIIRPLMRQIAATTQRRDFPYAINHLSSLEEDLLIFGSLYFGTVNGPKYLLDSGHHVQYPAKTHTILSIDIATLSRVVKNDATR